MRENGTVVRRGDDGLDVRIERSEACGSCDACAAMDGGQMLLTGVMDTKGAVVGDLIVVEVPEGTRLLASVLGYGMPVVALVAGYLAGYLLAGYIGWSGDTVGAVSSLAAVTLWFLWLRRTGKTLFAGAESRPVVHAIIRRGATP